MCRFTRLWILKKPLSADRKVCGAPLRNRKHSADTSVFLSAYRNFKKASKECYNVFHVPDPCFRSFLTVRYNQVDR